MQEIMTLEEAAVYLRVPERTVCDWAKNGELPAGKLGTTWRFKREDVENWSRTAKSNPAASGRACKDILAAQRVVIVNRIDKDAVLRRLVGLLAESPLICDREELLKSILAREALMSTGIGFGVGVPHVRIESVSDLVMAVAVSKRPIAHYVSLDRKPVHIVCMLAARPDQHTRYIRTLSAVSGRLKDADVRQAIIDSDDPAFVHMQMTSG